MEQSGKPNTFPTKEELFAAGRGDLVEAAVRKGGWLTVGWDFQRPSSSGSDLTQEKFEIHVNGSSGFWNQDRDLRNKGHRKPLQLILLLQNESLRRYQGAMTEAHPADSPSKTGQDIRTPAPLTRTSSRVYSTGASALSKKSSSCAASFSSTTETGGSNSFNSRLQKLETKLLATRAALKSGRATLLKGEDKLLQVQRKTSEDLAKAADSLEFKETEIMQTRAELRRTRAQVTAMQAKMALELSEARRAADEKQVLLDRAENALKMMRFVRIVWPNAASHVLLTGSFDGWTNKIKMEKSGAGVFVTALHLYPGRYEVKFIVDGTWRVDPCRPITYADGIENNVLMVS
ncbi:hypothetical protein SELMODRAFT_266879 [Selaginella moellendorffii]|uniref:AMP-activated protein kinase glycogen-binding domain-containing protein n=1 Tax=Selaginella moellendorffii TaxID=88036 RepID=D8R0S4_SELML|nr:hypothetical protein SELMODRAFT_266879 [Selaginella moellendorffii]